MNFIILRIIFRKYLHISKILLFAHTLFIIKNFYQISTYIIYYQKFYYFHIHYLLSKIFIKFPPLTSGQPKLPARCPLYNTCMITRLRPSMVLLLYPLGNPRTKSPWPENSRGFSEGLLSGYRISVYYIPEGPRWSIVSVLR